MKAVTLTIQFNKSDTMEFTQNPVKYDELSLF